MPDQEVGARAGAGIQISGRMFGSQSTQQEVQGSVSSTRIQPQKTLEVEAEARWEVLCS